MVSVPFIAYLNTVAGTLSYTVDFANDPVFFYVPVANNTDFCEAASLTSGFSVEKTSIVAVSQINGASGASASVSGKTQITVIYATDPGNNSANRVLGIVSY